MKEKKKENCAAIQKHLHLATNNGCWSKHLSVLLFQLTVRSKEVALQF